MNDGSCEAEYLGNRLRVFGGIAEEIVDVEVVGKDVDLICNVINVIKSSKYRIKNKCKYFFKVFWLKLQHIRYEEQLEIKKQFVIKELEGINKNIAKKLKMLFPVLRSIIIEITLDSQYQKAKIILAIQGLLTDGQENL